MSKPTSVAAAPSPPISPTTVDTANAFDAVRCLLAIAVLYSHTFFLGGYGPEPFYTWAKNQAIIGELAVLGFFGLSGYLVTGSYTRSHGLIAYFRKRVCRIIPGLWFCLLITAFILAPAIFFLRHHSLLGFPWLNGNQSALQFVTGNLAIKFQQTGISGVLDQANYDGSLNGSLWSLWPESLCYVILATLGLAGALDRNRPLLLLGIASLLALHTARTLMPNVGAPLLPTWLVLIDRVPYYLAYFVGAALWVWRHRFQPNWIAALLLLFALVVFSRLGGLRMLAPVFVPVALVLLGQCFVIHLRDDVSYGLYIYGFPVQQLLAATFVTRLPWPAFLGASLVLTFVCAILSWRLVERPFLRRRALPA